MTIVNPAGQEIASDVTSLTERQLKKQMAHNATIQDVCDIAHAMTVKGTNHLGNQIPALVEQMCTKMIAEAMAAFTQMLEERFVLVPREQPEKTDAL